MSGQLHVPPDAGAIATLVRGEQVVTIHKPGSPTFALHAIVRACDRYGWKVRSISTPATIYRDMQGLREQQNMSRAAADGWSNAHGSATGPGPRAEAVLLGRIGRLDVLA